VTLRLLVESEEALAAVEAAALGAGVRLHVWLEVDTGQHRTGVDPGSPLAAALARRLAGSDALAFDGLLTHAGQAYAAQGRADLVRVAEAERDGTVGLAERLRSGGVTVPGVSVGSTPTMAVAADLGGVTEIRPGNYVFNDFLQAANGVCGAEDCALTVLATVISHQPGAAHAVVDAGALALSKDPGPADAARRRGYGPLRPAGGAGLDPALQVVSVTQEHGVVAGASPGDVAGRLAVGDRVRILANHSCLTAALYDEYVVVRGDEVVGRWKVHRQR
jgi:D-serine deaminase-like pyridoxal phosphate-dependent protein